MVIAFVPYREVYRSRTLLYRIGIYKQDRVISSRFRYARRARSTIVHCALCIVNLSMILRDNKRPLSLLTEGLLLYCVLLRREFTRLF